MKKKTLLFFFLILFSLHKTGFCLTKVAIFVVCRDEAFDFSENTLSEDDKKHFVELRKEILKEEAYPKIYTIISTNEEEVEKKLGSLLQEDEKIFSFYWKEDREAYKSSFHTGAEISAFIKQIALTHFCSSSWTIQVDYENKE
jgi:hypothetical protein